jgi:RNA polymerase sigma-70 factor, ECF subfamily
MKEIYMFAQSALVAETGKLQKFALRLTKNKADADDLVQSTWLRALEKADYFEDGTNLFGWTSKIMFNIFAASYNRRTKFESQYDPEPYLEKESMAPTQEAGAEVSLVNKAMMNLSADHREVLVLICAKEMHYQEVSEMLQIPVGTVRSRLSRAREDLMTIMNAPHEGAAAREAAPLKPANANIPVIPAYIASRTLQRRA